MASLPVGPSLSRHIAVTCYIERLFLDWDHRFTPIDCLSIDYPHLLSALFFWMTTSRVIITWMMIFEEKFVKFNHDHFRLIREPYEFSIQYPILTTTTHEKPTHYNVNWLALTHSPAGLAIMAKRKEKEIPMLIIIYQEIPIHITTTNFQVSLYVTNLTTNSFHCIILRSIPLYHLYFIELKWQYLSTFEFCLRADGHCQKI